MKSARLGRTSNTLGSNRGNSLDSGLGIDLQGLAPGGLDFNPLKNLGREKRSVGAAPC